MVLITPYLLIFFFFFYRHYSPLWALACRTVSFHFFLSATNSLHLLTPSTCKSLSTSSFHLFLGLPLLLVLPVLEWRSFWASYPPPFSLGDLTSLSFALLSILLYFLHLQFLLPNWNLSFHNIVSFFTWCYFLLLNRSNFKMNMVNTVQCAGAVRWRYTTLGHLTST